MARADIIKRLDADHTEIYEYVGDERRAIVGDERKALIERWADNLIAESMARIRAERDGLLAESDWTQNTDAPVDTKKWSEYRQTLRDLPATIEDPTIAVDWPTPPK